MKENPKVRAPELVIEMRSGLGKNMNPAVIRRSLKINLFSSRSAKKKSFVSKKNKLKLNDT